MSRARLLDAAARSRVATLDPALPHLATALAPPPGTTGWSLHDVRWSPGESCVVAFRVRRDGFSGSTFVAREVTADGWAQRSFRRDPYLPGLARLNGSAAAAEPVRYRPGSRCVLRYAEPGRAGAHLYAKVLRAEPGSAALTVPAALAQPAPGLRASLVPRLVAAWPEHGVLVHEAVAGRSVSAVLGDPAVAASDRLRLAFRLGRLLARLHAQPVAAPAASAQDALDRLAAPLAAARLADEPVGSRLARAVEVLSTRRPDLGPDVLGHGGFRAGQVVAGGGRLTVLDLDGACRCAPERDVATALAHLAWQAVLHEQEAAVLREAGRAFTAGYQHGGGRLDADALRWWHAVALVQVAARRYRRLEVRDWAHVPYLVDRLEDLLARPPAADSGELSGARLTRRHQMTTLLRPVLAPVAADPAAVEITGARLVKQAPGRRTVVRYAVRGLDPAGPAHVVAKLFTEPHRASLTDTTLRALSAGPFAANGLRVPAPLPALPGQGLVLFRGSAGTRLDRLDGAAALAGCRAAGRWLARLHGADVVLDRQLDLATEAASVQSWAELVASAEPGLASLAETAAERWAAAAGQERARCDVPMHKDFHPGHVLVGATLTVLDLDEARMGDPALDVAHFCAYLQLQHGPRYDRLQEAFLAEYATAAGAVPAHRLPLFTALTWLKIAKQLARGTGPHVIGSGVERTAAVAAALERGLACLDR